MSEEEEMESVLDGLEEDLRLGRFEMVDRWLSTASPDGLYPATVIAALSITFWAKEQLVQRDDFLRRAERSLRMRLGDARAESLLVNRR